MQKRKRSWFGVRTVYVKVSDDYKLEISWNSIKYEYRGAPEVTIPAGSISRSSKNTKGIEISHKVTWLISLPPDQFLIEYSVNGLKLNGWSGKFGNFSL